MLSIKCVMQAVLTSCFFVCGLLTIRLVAVSPCTDDKVVQSDAVN